MLANFQRYMGNGKNAYEYYEHKYHRKIKIWTIDQLHDLYLKAKERSDKKWKLSSDCLEEISKQVEKDKSGGWVFFAKSKDGTILRYNMRWDNLYKSYTISNNTVDSYNLNRMDKTDKRDGILAFLTATDIQKELGQKYYNYSRDRSYLDHIVFKILWEEVSIKLSNHFNSLDILPPKNFDIKICGYKYYVSYDMSYRKFNCLGSKQIDTIEIN